jgi:hypothetical protein
MQEENCLQEEKYERYISLVFFTVGHIIYFLLQLFIQRIFNPKLPTSKEREKVFILVNEC